MKNLRTTLAALVLCAPALAAADPLPKQVADMDCLVGSWKGDGTLVAGKDKARISATWSCARTSASYGVLCSLRVTGIPGLPVYDETDLLGYEPNSNTYHWYAVTNAGETHDHVAKPNTGNTIEFVYNATQEGKAYKEVIALEFGKDDKSIVGKSETFVAGLSSSVLKLSLHK